jgi:HK97 family phage prohead protease
MPYFITDKSADCSGWAVVKEDGEVIGCHQTKDDAIAQMVAVSVAEKIPPGGQRMAGGERAVIVDIDGTLIYDGKRVDAVYEFVENLDAEIFIVTGRPDSDRSETVAELEALDIDYKELFMNAGSTADSNKYKASVAEELLKVYDVVAAVENNPDARKEYAALGIPVVDPENLPEPTMAEDELEDEMEDEAEDEVRAPAPPKDQITGSDENKPDSAKGAGGNIDFDEATETGLRNKVKDHNDSMDELGKPDWTRTTLGQLKAVYRRGSGAYSVSHRPGVSRAAWSMARVNAFLYLLRNGRPANKAYITDFDLLPEGHPKSTRANDGQKETRAVNLTPPAFMRAAARRGLQYYSEGLAGDGLQDKTVREARAMAAGNVTADKWVRIAAWIARHLVDLDAPKNNDRTDPAYPGAGLVAHLLWGSGPSRALAVRAKNYAERVVSQIRDENEARYQLHLEKESKGSPMANSLTKMEHRTAQVKFELRQVENDTDRMSFVGYAAVFNSASEPLPFTEVIERGAFSRSLKSRNDVKLLLNHDTGRVLGSTRAGTLRLIEDEIGLRAEADLPPTTDGNDISILLQRGDIDSMSFGFTVPVGGDSWNADGSVRTLKSVRIHEVSIVTFPAYTATTASVRSVDATAIRADVDAEELADALLKIEANEDLTERDAAILNEVVSKLTAKADDPVVAIETLSTDVLLKKLDLLKEVI